uniref:Uncharacterized protein n=1 Tax=Cacopsylla melanoneura TaxID=428564 RepID=A0A8D8VI13_9HEMI
MVRAICFLTKGLEQKPTYFYFLYSTVYTSSIDNIPNVIFFFVFIYICLFLLYLCILCVYIINISVKFHHSMYIITCFLSFFFQSLMKYQYYIIRYYLPNKKYYQRTKCKIY